MTRELVSLERVKQRFEEIIVDIFGVEIRCYILVDNKYTIDEFD
jgi:hypothetical protein